MRQFKDVTSDLDRQQRTRAYELESGQRVKILERMVVIIGAAKVLHQMGLIEDPATAERYPVYQWGSQIGTLPGDLTLIT